MLSNNLTVCDLTKFWVSSMKEEMTFGAFVREKRVNKEPYISLRKVAETLGLSAPYLSNVETNREVAPKREILAKLAEILHLDKYEKARMYDLAAKSKNHVAVPADLPEYISEHELARTALRVAKEVDATDKEWQEFINKLKKRGKIEE